MQQSLQEDSRTIQYRSQLKAIVMPNWTTDLHRSIRYKTSLINTTFNIISSFHHKKGTTAEINCHKVATVNWPKKAEQAVNYLQAGSVICVLNIATRTKKKYTKHIKLRRDFPDDNEMKGKDKTCTEINCLWIQMIQQQNCYKINNEEEKKISHHTIYWMRHLLYPKK